MDDQNTPNTEPTSAPAEPVSSQPNSSTPTDLPPIAPESPTDASTTIPVEDQNGVVNVVAPQTQSSAQFDQVGFVKSLLIKAQAKIQFNKQKKLEKIVVLAQKKKMITNDDVQKLLYVSDATATRYLVKLVQQGRLARAGNPRDAKYQFVR